MPRPCCAAPPDSAQAPTTARPTTKAGWSNFPFPQFVVGRRVCAARRASHEIRAAATRGRTTAFGAVRERRLGGKPNVTNRSNSGSNSNAQRVANTAKLCVANNARSQYVEEDLLLLPLLLLLVTLG